MIKEVDFPFIPTLSKSAEPPILEAEVRILGLLSAYRHNIIEYPEATKSYLKFWECFKSDFDGDTENRRGIIALYSGSAIVVPTGEQERDEEIMLFLNMNPEVRKIRTTKDFGERMMADYGSMWHFDSNAVMTAGAGLQPPPTLCEERGDGQSALSDIADKGGNAADVTAKNAAISDGKLCGSVKQNKAALNSVQADNTSDFRAATNGSDFPTENAAQMGRLQELTARESYPLLVEVFGEKMPPFEDWYVDISHRIRHGACRIVGFKEGDRVMSTAITVAENSGEGAECALIGAVATHPDARGRGYASSGVLYLAHQLLGEGKRVLLSPKNDHALNLYEKIGFEICGFWGELHRL